MHVCFSIDHIRIRDTELELDCSQSSCEQSFHAQMFLMIFPRMILHCKLAPVQYEYEYEYEYGLLSRVSLDCKQVPVHYILRIRNMVPD